MLAVWYLVVSLGSLAIQTFSGTWWLETAKGGNDVTSGLILEGGSCHGEAGTRLRYWDGLDGLDGLDGTLPGLQRGWADFL